MTKPNCGTCFFEPENGHSLECKEYKSWEKDLISNHKLELLFYGGKKGNEVGELLEDIESLISEAEKREYKRGWQEASEKAGFNFINIEIPIKEKEARDKTLTKVIEILKEKKTKVHLDNGIPCGEICWCGAEKYNQALSEALEEIEKLR